MESVTTVKKWGSSAAIILPASLVRAEHLEIGDEVVVEVHLLGGDDGLFGSWRGTKPDSQAMKDATRKEEASAERRKGK